MTVISAYTLRSARPRLADPVPVMIPLDETERDPFRVVRDTVPVAAGVVRVIRRRGVWTRACRWMQ